MWIRASRMPYGARDRPARVARGHEADPLLGALVASVRRQVDGAAGAGLTARSWAGYIEGV